MVSNLIIWNLYIFIAKTILFIKIEYESLSILIINCVYFLHLNRHKNYNNSVVPSTFSVYLENNFHCDIYPF